MHRILSIGIVLISALFLSNCFYATQFGMQNGLLYSSGSSGFSGSFERDDYKQGEACATSILGLVATGDASISAASSRAGIQKIANVSHKVEGVLGYYQKYCTVVRGY